LHVKSIGFFPSDLITKLATWKLQISKLALKFPNKLDVDPEYVPEGFSALFKIVVISMIQWVTNETEQSGMLNVISLISPTGIYFKALFTHVPGTCKSLIMI